jgi:two-component system, OmpR family, response regulator
MNLLIIEDDPEIAKNLLLALNNAGHQVEHADNGIDGLEKANNGHADIIILDRMLPGMDGIDVLKNLRKNGSSTPVLLLSALGEVDHRVEGLQLGADDYLTKPFSFIELQARLEALHRREAHRNPSTRLQVGDLMLDLINHTAERDGQTIELLPIEYKLLEYLMRSEGQVVTRNMLLDHVWNLAFDPQTNIVEVHVSRLRGKIDKQFSKKILHTIRGEGYALREDI